MYFKPIEYNEILWAKYAENIWAWKKLGELIGNDE